MDEFEFLAVVESEAVVTIRLNRPEKRNALGVRLHRELLDALSALEGRDDLKALVVTGTGESFCAGMDLEECFFRPFKDPKLFNEINDTAQAWFRKLRHFPAPTLARVNGWCFGGGILIVGLCDLAIAASDAVLGLSEINFGSFPGGGTTWAVGSNLSRKHALYYTLTGSTFSGARAAEIGLVNLAVPASELDAAVEQTLVQLRSKHPLALRAAKRVYEGAIRRSFSESIEWEMAKLHELSYVTGDDWIEGALGQFSRREYRPGFEAYELERDR